jgi:putative transposase
VSRPLRIEYPGAFYHVTSRGNERKIIFQNSRDREKYLTYLESAHDRYGAIIHVYCLMGNHYHLLLETPRGNLSKVLHHINGAYTTYFNVKRGRSGHLFQGRFKGILVERDAYCKELSRYIHLNPVRAGLVKSPSEYPWSSYRYFIGRDKKPEWLTTEIILGEFGSEERERYRAYREYVERGETKGLESPFKRVIASTFLGSEEFINDIRVKYLEKRRIDKRNVPAAREVLLGPSFGEIEKAVVNVLGKDHALNKKMCIYLSHRHSGMKLDEIGAYFGKKGSAISQLSRRFKEALGGDKGLRGILNRIEKEGLLNVET